jgi:4-amino-4-deoxy-L-arabinose transferase-like glycosyltransferase
VALPRAVLGPDPASLRSARGGESSACDRFHGEEPRLSLAGDARSPIPRLGRAGLAIFALALAARLAAAASSGLSTVGFADAPAYLRAAQSLAQTGRYPLRTDPYYFRPPGYSAFLTVITLGHPERIAVAKVANAALGALAAWLIAVLGARIFRKRGVALAAGFVAAVDPSLIFVSSDVQTEPLFLALLLAAAFLLLVCVDRPSSNFGVLAGLLLGLAILTRPSALALTPLLLAPLADRRYPARARAHLAGSALLGLALGLAPWVIRNAVVYRDFILVSDVGGLNTWIGNGEEMRRFYDLRSRADYERWAAENDRVTRARIGELEASGLATPAAVSRALLRETLADGAARPAWHLELLLRKAWDWLRPFPNPLFWPRAVVVGIGAFYAILYGLATLGLAEAPRRGVSLFALSVLALSMAAHVASVVSWRYRVPYWDPILILYSAYAVFRSAR